MNLTKTPPARKHPKTLFAASPDFKFTSKAELDAYLGGSRITCLICGNAYRVLGSHINRRHELSVKDYQLRFGIPAGLALASPSFRKQTGARLRQLRADGKIPERPGPEVIERLKRVRPTRKVVMEVTRKEATQRLMRVLGKDEPWDEPSFNEFLRRIEQGRTVPEIAKDPDMPTQVAFKKYLAKNKAFRQRYDALWEAVPFEQQVRARKTGKRYQETVSTLRKKGMSWLEVSEIMGVSPATLRNMWYFIKKRENKAA